MSLANVHFNQHWILNVSPEFWLDQLNYEVVVEESSEGLSNKAFLDMLNYEVAIEETTEDSANKPLIWLDQVTYEVGVEEQTFSTAAPDYYVPA